MLPALKYCPLPTVVLFFTVSCNAYAASEKPNVVFIMVDNWGWGDLSVQGSTIATPRIDQLANEGLRLTNYNVEKSMYANEGSNTLCTSTYSLRYCKEMIGQPPPKAWHHGSILLRSYFMMLAMQLPCLVSGI